MRVLVHLGLNKCASTYVQHALSAARTRLGQAGTWYPIENGRNGHYGLSRHYGFGPDAPEVADKTIGNIVDAASALGCDQIILSSEYLSLYRPHAAERFVAALNVAGCSAEYVLFSRDIPDWLQSLFNQYVRTVDSPRPLPGISAFVDQVLRNRTVDVAQRHNLWADLVAPGALRHYQLGPDLDQRAVLRPFSAFSGVRIPSPTIESGNASIGPNELFRIGQLRSTQRTDAADKELQYLLSGGKTPQAAPDGYLTISPDRFARIEAEITAPYEALWKTDLDTVMPLPATTFEFEFAAKQPAMALL